MAAKMELKPAKPILKPHYTLSEALQRLQSLGADIYSEQDLIDIALGGKIKIELLVTESLLLLTEDSDTIGCFLTEDEKAELEKKIFASINPEDILVQQETDPDLYDFNFDPFAELPHVSRLLTALSKRLVFSANNPIYSKKNEIKYLEPSLVGNLVDYLNDKWLLFKPVTGILIQAEQRGYARATINGTNYLSIKDISFELMLCDLEPITKSHPETEKVLTLIGYLDPTPIQQAIDARQLVITRKTLSEFEQFELGFNHGLDYEFKPQKKIAPNIIAYNQQRQQNLTPDPDDVQAKYNELHAQNPKQSKNQLHQKLAKHFDTSVSTIKRRLKAIK